MDFRKRRKHSVDKLPVGTIRVRKKKRTDGSRFKIRFIKVSQRGRGGLKWMRYSRWLWERTHGPVPRGKCVLHRDGDVLNDDLANLFLGTAGDKLWIHCHADPAKSEENRRRCSAATAAFNREIAFLRRATDLLPSRWYLVDIAKSAIINDPKRSARQLLAGHGSINGRGSHGWAMGWPELSATEAFALAVLADGVQRSLTQLAPAVNTMRNLWGMPPLRTSTALVSFMCHLRRRGYLAPIGRGLYKVSAAALAMRSEVLPLVPVRGSVLLSEDRFAGFELSALGQAVSAE